MKRQPSLNAFTPSDWGIVCILAVFVVLMVSGMVFNLHIGV